MKTLANPSGRRREGSELKARLNHPLTAEPAKILAAMGQRVPGCSRVVHVGLVSALEPQAADELLDVGTRRFESVQEFQMLKGRRIVSALDLVGGEGI